ncbi:MAG: phosphatidylglycerophosphatase A [Aminobacteriaceae bacterium]
MPKNKISSRKYQGRKDFEWCVSTLFGLGFYSSMPGTLGSVAGFLAYVVFPVPRYVILATAILGVYASDAYSKRIGVTDPREVIIDEVVGVWIAMDLMPPVLLLPALFLFRVIDIIKPFPVNAFERLPGGWGIMADDCAGGVIVNILLVLLRRVFSI